MSASTRMKAVPGQVQRVLPLVREVVGGKIFCEDTTNKAG
jgi:hypothetical protein